MKIGGFWSGHDCSFCILEDGIPTIHAEYERYIREKEPQGDSVKFFNDRKGIMDFDHITTCYPKSKLEQYESYKSLETKVNVFPHHKCHAANAYYSSNFDNAIIVTLDGGGIEDENGKAVATSVYYGKDNHISKVVDFPTTVINIGSIWTRCTRYIFELQSGWPRGHQAGTVMAMAAMGNSERFKQDFLKMLTDDLLQASFKPSTQPVGPFISGCDPKHPYLDKWRKIALISDQNRYDLAAGLQSATEEMIILIIENAIKYSPESEYLALAGGVTLNSVAMGKLYDAFDFKEIFITPTPHDGGLAIGSAQLLYHDILGHPKIKWEDNSPVCMGENWKHSIESTLVTYENDIVRTQSNDDDVIDLIADGKIVSIFNKGSESGRRALGNRSILADPRDPNMKDRVNHKVKHRQSFRPFAPSILREEVINWFVRDINSPYMGFVIKFKDDAKLKVPAVVHFDGTARLQTVTENDNYWYYNLLKKWHVKSGVPILLNTSFNDREPICETPKHAVNCFLNTSIDYLYFPETKDLIRKV